LVPLIGFGYLDDVRIASMAAMPELLGSSVGALKAGTVGATPEKVALLKNAILGPIIEQLKIEPDIETLAQLLDSWAEIIALGGECSAAKFDPQQLADSFDTCKTLLEQSLQRRAKRNEEATGDDADEDEVGCC